MCFVNWQHSAEEERESSIQLQQFHKSGWYFYWWSSSSNNWRFETNQHWYCWWKSAASQTCKGCNFQQIGGQKSRLVSQWHQIKLFPFNNKSLSFSISMKGRKNVEAFHFFRFNISLASIFSHGHKDYCNGHYNPKLIFIHQSWPAQVKGSIIES